MDSLNTAVSTGIDGGSKGARKKTMLELKHFREQHMWDLWLDLEKYENIENVNDSGIVEEEAVLDGSLTGANSPYAEVRAAVSQSPICYPGPASSRLSSTGASNR